MREMYPFGIVQPTLAHAEHDMNEDAFNLSIRKFLKHFGVTAQREIEHAIQRALAEGKLKGTETSPVRATLTIGDLGAEHRVDGEITLA